jgi:hypothetical protein
MFEKLVSDLEAHRVRMEELYMRIQAKVLSGVNCEDEYETDFDDADSWKLASTNGSFKSNSRDLKLFRTRISPDHHGYPLILRVVAVDPSLP